MPDSFAGFEVREVRGVPVLWRQDARFKSLRLMLSCRRSLDRRAAARSLLPDLLQQGTERDPDRPALARRREWLYGARVAAETVKLGESHLLRCSLDSVSGRFLPDHPDLFGDGLAFLSDVVARPRLEDGAFPADVFARERLQAANRARAVFDDKGSWAAQQALIHACAGEPYAIPEHGGVEAIEALRSDEVEAARRDFLERGRLWVVALGALPRDGSVESVAAFLDQLPARHPEPVGPPAQPDERPLRRTVERAELQQSKLVLVFRMPWTVDSATWVSRALFTSMFGGGPHSRLFREVREKQSLAYYAHAAQDRHKGVLSVHVGLDEAAAESVEREAQNQARLLQQGEFTDEELETARAGVLSALAAVTDSVARHLEFVSHQWMLGQDRTPEQQAGLYLRCGRDDVVRGARGIWLDHSYLLAPSGGTEAR